MIVNCLVSVFKPYSFSAPTTRCCEHSNNLTSGNRTNEWASDLTNLRFSWLQLLPCLVLAVLVHPQTSHGIPFRVSGSDFKLELFCRGLELFIALSFLGLTVLACSYRASNMTNAVLQLCESRISAVLLFILLECWYICCIKATTAATLTQLLFLPGNV